MGKVPERVAAVSATADSCQLASMVASLVAPRSRKTSPFAMRPCYARAMIRAKACLLPAALCALTAACSTAGNYPSLAVRDVERVRGSASPAPAEATPLPSPPPASADLTTRLEGLVAMAREADRQFQASRGNAERAVAAAGTVPADSWSTASVALARLENARSAALVALADLDTLYVDAREDAPLEETPRSMAIAAARGQVEGWVSAQDEVIGRLAGRLRN